MTTGPGYCSPTLQEGFASGAKWRSLELRGGAYLGKHSRLRAPAERGRSLRRGPVGRFQEVLEGLCLFDTVEVERDVDVLVVVDGLVNTLRADPSLLPSSLESRERT